MFVVRIQAETALMKVKKKFCRKFLSFTVK